MSSPTHVLSHAPLGAAADTPRAAWGGLIRRAFDMLAAWRARSRERHELASLSDRALGDMGLNRATIMAECDKPFWRE